MTSTRHILVVHGALGSAEQMQPVAEALQSLGTVHSVELPGHGSTPMPHGLEFNIPTLGRALQQAATEMVQREATRGLAPLVFGYSMGGYVALALEAQHPGTFGGIVTLGTKFAWTPLAAERGGAWLNPTTVREKVPAFAKTLEDRHAGAGGWEAVLQHTAALLTQLGDRPLLTRDTMRAIQVPVCVAVGERDDTVTEDEAREYASYMTKGQTETLPGAPHPIERVPVAAIAALFRHVL